MNLWTQSATGPASYSTGGFVVTTSLATLAAFDVEVSIPGVLGQVRAQVTLNSPSAGKATVKLLRETYQLLTVSTPTGLPSGVTSPTSSGSSVATETPHSHAADHDHAISAASATMSGGSGLVTQAAAGGVNISTHTHTSDLANMAVTSGTQTHQHTWDSIYEHQHAVSNATTDVTLVELDAATNISGTTFNYIGVDA